MKCEPQNANEIWQRVLLSLQKKLNANVYSAWIAPLEFLKIENNTCILRASTKFTGDWVSRNYGDIIQQFFLMEECHIERILFECAPKELDSAFVNKNKEPTKKEDDTSTSLLIGSLTQTEHNTSHDTYLRSLEGVLDPRLTFENFITGAPNNLAYAAARRIGCDRAISFNPLFLYGGIGLGKTHLLQAIASDMRASHPNAKIFYLTAEQFTYRFVKSLRAGSSVDFKALLRSPDMLLIDDIQFIAGKNTTQSEFIHTFNEIVDNGKQIVVSASCPPFEITDMDERIKSRLQSGLVIDLQPADYALRLGILEQKCVYQSKFYPDVHIDAPVLEFVAQNINSNIRVLEGALNRLFAFGELVKKPVTLDMARENLSQLLRGVERKITLDNIISHVADHYNISVNDMLSVHRGRTVARPRQIAMYLAKKLTHRSYPEIGRRFGGRDHTTVLHAVRQIEKLRAQNADMSQDIDILDRNLNG